MEKELVQIVQSLKRQYDALRSVEGKLNLAKKYGFKDRKSFVAYIESVLGKETKDEVEVKEETEKESSIESPEKKEAKGIDGLSYDNSKLDMVIAFDTTGSMRSYINTVKSQVESLISKLFEEITDLRIKLVAFGDYCDKPDDRYQYTQLTNDKKLLINFVKNSKKTRGGDSDEFYEYVIQQVLDKTSWREDSKKVLFLIGDAEPHEVGYKYNDIVNTIDWRKECKRAKEMNVQIDTLRIYPFIDWYKEASEITGGVCLEFSNSDKINQVIEGLAYARTSTVAYKTLVLDYSDDLELKTVFNTISKTLGTL